VIKKTLHFGQPYYLSTEHEQLVAKPATEGLPVRRVPVEDIGIIILEHPQITISHGLMAKLLANNAAVVTCDDKFHPSGLLLCLDGHSQQTARFRAQMEASLPLKKQLWQQTVKAKIANQAAVLDLCNGDAATALRHIATKVGSGDPENQEARAAVIYWPDLFGSFFIRDRDGEPPNQLLNYGYAILRATVARGLVGSGLLPSFGIFHRNQYNAYCLADDIMEPYRPFVDRLVWQLWHEEEDARSFVLTTGLKRVLLQIPALDIHIDGKGSPLMVGLQRTTASLAACFLGESRKILYPEISA
jgi:CRISPR-associated protein Cas1